MNQQLITQTVIDFNETLLSLAINISNACPNSLIGNNINEIQRTIKKLKPNDKNFNKFIELFTVKVLQYKTQIDSGDESFFMDKDYKSDLGEEHDSYFDSVVSLKSIWKDLKKENKQIVISFMQVLCELAQQYFDTVYV